MGIEAGALHADLAVIPLAHMTLAALGEAGLLIASADDLDATRIETESAVLALFDGLRTESR